MKKQTKKRKPRASPYNHNGWVSADTVATPNMENPVEAAKTQAHRTLRDALKAALEQRWAGAGLGRVGSIAVPKELDEGPERNVYRGLTKLLGHQPIVMQVSKTMTPIAVLGGADQSSKFSAFLSMNCVDLCLYGAL